MFPQQFFWQLWGLGRRSLSSAGSLQDFGGCKTNFPQTRSHPSSLAPWYWGHTLSWEQLLPGFLAWSVPESRLPSGHAEADSAHGALGDLPR